MTSDQREVRRKLNTRNGLDRSARHAGILGSVEPALTNGSTNTGSLAWPTPAGPSRLGDGIQRSTATQHPGIPDPGRLRRAESPTGMRSPVASGPLRSYPRHDKHTNDNTHPVSATDPGMPIGRRRRRGRPGAGAQNLSQSDDTKRRIVGVSEHWPRRERGKTRPVQPRASRLHRLGRTRPGLHHSNRSVSRRRIGFRPMWQAPWRSG